jgi:hypothetical protein
MKSRNAKKVAGRAVVGFAALGLVAVLPACGKGGPGQPNDMPETTRAVRVNVLVMGTLVYPTEQFHLAPPDRCDAPHWHAAREVFSIGTAGALEAVVCHDGYQFQQASDPDPGGCGFGRVSEVTRLEMVVSAACWANWLARH